MASNIISSYFLTNCPVILIHFQNMATYLELNDFQLDRRGRRNLYTYPSLHLLNVILAVGNPVYYITTQ